MPDLAMRPESLRRFATTVAHTAGGLTAPGPATDHMAGVYGAGFDEAHRIHALTVRAVHAADRLLRSLEDQVRAMEITVRMAADTTQQADEDSRRELARLLATINAGTENADSTPATASPRDVS